MQTATNNEGTSRSRTHSGASAAFTSSYVPPGIPRGNYRSVPVPKASTWQLWRAHAMMFFLINSWIGSIVIPLVVFPVTLYFGYYLVFCLLLALLAFPHISKLESNIFVQWVICKYAKCFMAYHEHQLTIYYLDGAKEVLNRHSRATFLDYSPRWWCPRSRSENSTHQSDQEVMLPIVDLSTLSHVSTSASTSTSTSTSASASASTQPSSSADNTSASETQQQRAPSLEAYTHPKPALICYHPHGVFCVGMFLGGICNNTLAAINPCIRYLIAPALTKAPYFQYIIDWLDLFGPASNDYMQEQMKQGKDLGLLPGGFEEASLYTYGNHLVYINKRKGFIKYALQYGYDIVPVYSFGDEKSHINLLGNVGKKLKLILNRYKIPCVFPWGKYLFSPFTSHKFDIIYGEPLLLPTIDNPSKEQVDYWHQQYIQRLTDIFNQNKSKVGQPNAQLLIH